MILFHGRVLETVNFEDKFRHLPQFKPEDYSPSAVVVPSSPQLMLRKKLTKGLGEYGASLGHN